MPEPIVICPHTTLSGSKRDTSPISINVADVTIECGYGGIGRGCVVEKGGSHFSFGKIRNLKNSMQTYTQHFL